MTETQTRYKHTDGRWVLEHCHSEGDITYDSNFDLDQDMREYGASLLHMAIEEVDQQEAQDEGFMLISEWLEENGFQA